MPATKLLLGFSTSVWAYWSFGTQMAIYDWCYPENQWHFYHLSITSLLLQPLKLVCQVIFISDFQKSQLLSNFSFVFFVSSAYITSNLHVFTLAITCKNCASIVPFFLQFLGLRCLVLQLVLI